MQAHGAFAKDLAHWRQKVDVTWWMTERSVEIPSAGAALSPYVCVLGTLQLDWYALDVGLV